MSSLVASIALGLALATGAPVAAQESVDVSALGRKAMAEDPVEAGVFEQIAAADTRLALNTLFLCCDRAPAPRRPAAVWALRRFAGNEDLEGAAVEFLGERALEDKVQLAERRAAARALVRYGRAAQEPLERVVRESNDELTRVWAIGGIVTLLRVRGTEDALDLLLENYRPPLSGTVEAGAKALGAFDDEDSIERLDDLLIHSRTDPRLREVIVETVAARPGEDATAALRRALRIDDAQALVRVLDALRERGVHDHTARLATLSRDPSPDVRAAAFRALTVARYGEAIFDKKLRRALAGYDFALRRGALAGLGDVGDVSADAWIVKRLEDENVSVRRAAIEQVRRRRIKAAIPGLVDQLESGRPALRELSREVLVELTGLDHGPRSARWLKWWDGEGADFVLPGRDEALAGAAAARARNESGPTRAASPTGSFYGVRFASDRVVFVLDLSGSMETDDRIGRMKTEALSAIADVPDGSSLDLVAFADRASAWKGRLTAMNDGTRRQAEQAIERLTPNGATNLHAGLRQAYSDPGVETIVLLSDGEPTRGVTDVDAILADVRTWDMGREVVIHTVSLGADDHSGLMELLAATTGGEAMSGF